MERLRWLQRDPPKTRIDVNTAASFLDYWRDGQHVDHRKVINGEADKPTPQLQAPIFQPRRQPDLDACPNGIAAKELATKSQAGLREQRLHHEGRPLRPAVGPEELARPGQVRHAGRRGDLPSRHAGQGRCSRFPTAIAATAACGSRTRSSSRPRWPQQEGVLDQFQQAMAKNDETSSSCQDRNSRSGCSTRPHSGTARGFSSGPTFMAGTKISPRRSTSRRGRRGRSSSPRAATTSGRRYD